MEKYVLRIIILFSFLYYEKGKGDMKKKKIKTYKSFKMFSKDQAYWERNQLVAALSKIYPSSIGWHSGKDWDDEWRNIVYITIPVAWYHMMPMESPLPRDRQISWHIHEDDLIYFKHLRRKGEQWDGHTTEEKYERLQNLWIYKPKHWWEFWKI